MDTRTETVIRSRSFAGPGVVAVAAAGVGAEVVAEPAAGVAADVGADVVGGAWAGADPEAGAVVDAGADGELLVRLRAGEESAFAELVARYLSRLAGLAYSLGARGELVQDIVQETWVAVLRGLSRFEGRSSLQSWLFRICANRARTMTAREQRVIPLAPERFGPDGGWPEQDWAAAQPWRQDVPDSEPEPDAELAARIEDTIAGLDGKQGRVVALRDAQGMSSAQVCEILSITEANQRVLLHRGRARVRAALAVR